MEIARPRKKIANVLIILGALIILIGSITPIAYDIEDEPHSFLNNLTAFLIMIALLLVIAVLVFYYAFTNSTQAKRSISRLLLILSILFFLMGTVSVIAVTAAIIDNEPGWGPGLYIMYAGILIFFVGSTINLQENRKKAKGERVLNEGPEGEDLGQDPYTE